jgi:adenosylhomocysteine nucleosidase
MIAITFALPTESHDLVQSIDRTEVAIVHTGVGPKAAARRMNDFLSAQQPRFVISSGFAGGLRDDLNVGDLILAENYSSGQLLKRAGQLLFAHNARPGKLFSSNAIADSSNERSALRDKHGADAVDMESDVIAAACAARGVEMLSLRVITDTPSEPLPAPPDVLFDIERQRTRILMLMLYCLAHPKALPRLTRFSRNVGFARAELTSALHTLLREQHLLAQ